MRWDQMEKGDRYNILEGNLGVGLLRFGVPLSAGMALHAMFNVVDIAVVGNLPEGARALGVIALCDLLAMIGTVVSTGVGNAAAAIISRRLGAGDSSRAAQACWGSLCVLLAAGVFFGAVALMWSGDILWVMGAKGWLHGQATKYLEVILGGVVTIFALLHVTSALRAAGHSATPTMLVFGANVLNLILSVVLVYGPGEAPKIFAWGPPIARFFSAPHLGIMGAAWGTVIARGLVVLPGLVLVARDFSWPSLSSLVPDWKEVKQLWDIGWPSTAQYAVRIAGILVLLAVIGHWYTTEDDQSALSAMGICIRLDTIGLFMALGWGSAAATFVGHNLGAGNYCRARRAGWLAARICGVKLALVGIAYLLFADDLVPLFTDGDAVKEWCLSYLGFVAPVYGLVGVGAALSTALTGAGETMASFRIDSLVILGLQTPLLLLVALLGAPLQVCFAAVAVGHLLTSGLYVYAFSRGRWRKRAVE